MGKLFSVNHLIGLMKKIPLLRHMIKPKTLFIQFIPNEVVFCPDFHIEGNILPSRL